MALSAMPSRVRAEQGRTVTARVRGREASKRGVGPNGIGFHPYASVQGRLLETLNEVCARDGTTVVLVGHHLTDAKLLQAEIAVLEEGRVCEQGEMGELLKSPRSRTMEAWAGMGSMRREA